MYQALYRKWRPKVFDDVFGQEHITRTLKNEIQSGQFSHAYLFTGSRGTGKTTCAKLLAKAVNCLTPADGNPCLSCDSCRQVEQGSTMDVVEIDAASNNGVDNIRQLREEANYAPAQCRYRVYIIDEAHMLSIGAFNALLKIMEEPPPHVIFILATTEVHKIPLTILSRCQRFDFRRITPDDIAKRLLYIAGQEGFSLTGEAAQMIARLSDGGMRDAISLMDQCAGVGETVNERVVRDTAMLAGNEHLFSLADAIEQGDAGKALETISAVYAQSKNLERLCSELVTLFRNIMVYKTVGPDSNVIDCMPDEMQQIGAFADRLPIRRLLNCIEALHGCLIRQGRSADARMELELTLIGLCDMHCDASNEGLLARIEALEAQMQNGLPVAPASSAIKETAPVPQVATKGVVRPAEKAPPSKQPVAASETIEQKAEAGVSDGPFARWADLLAVLEKTDKPLQGLLVGAQAQVCGGTLQIDCDSPILQMIFKQKEHQDKLREAIVRVCGAPMPVKVGEAAQVQSQDDPMQKILDQAKRSGVEVIEKSR